ncbi:hypothetical protein EVAR_37173_1 [Eumeta japonica]|uniref:Uncharacterized protein n=1 Tax=Eumeta variegata TaxID=151549 RepID=A0A4C1WLL7_EUMVA|nr:hypothetical protein EVAR_37173_1 [Eumeta japonica]
MYSAHDARALVGRYGFAILQSVHTSHIPVFYSVLLRDNSVCVARAFSKNHKRFVRSITILYHGYYLILYVDVKCIKCEKLRRSKKARRRAPAPAPEGSPARRTHR